MTGHEMKYRREERFARLGVPSNQGIDSYPCLATCKNPEHNGGPNSHTGSNVFIFARCSCGWEELAGTHIHEYEALLQGRLAHMQHQIDMLQ